MQDVGQYIIYSRRYNDSIIGILCMDKVVYISMIILPIHNIVRSQYIRPDFDNIIGET